MSPITSPRLRSVLFAFGLFGLFGPGCIVDVSPSSTACGGAGRVCCSTGCGVGLVCSTANVCVSPVSGCGTLGQACCAGNACAAGLACGASGVCGGAVGRGAYEACAAGEACGSGTVCTTAMYSTTGAPGNLCTIGCTQGAQCPVSPYGSVYAPTCIVSVSAGSGLCYDTCLTDADCGGGTVCALIPGTTARVCVPRSATAPVCGAAGQVCCTGGACGAGLGCVGGVCAAATTRAAYAKCTPGEACASGTQCIVSNAQVAGKSRGYSCTTGCAGGPAVCPYYVPGSATQSVACVNLTGVLAEAQCFRLCATQNECLDTNTTCTAFTLGDGTSVRLCVPAGPRA